MSEKPKILTPEEVRARDLSELPEFLSDIETLVTQLNILRHGTHIKQVVLQPYDSPENNYRTHFTHKVAHIKFELAEVTTP